MLTVTSRYATIYIVYYIYIYSRLLYTVTADNEPSGVDPPMRVRRKRIIPQTPSSRLESGENGNGIMGIR